MKNNKWKGRWWLWIPIGILGLVIYSCLQGEWDPDANTTNEVVWNKNKELTVYEAERWYNANNLPVATVRSLGSETEVLTKPKWRNAKESRRKHFEVVETPLLVKGRAVFMDAETKGHFDPKKEAKKIRNVARMVIIKNLKTGEVSNFIMIFVGTYDYLMNTKTLWKNSYLHREPDYEGDVYFYKPSYGFVNGWRYKAGKIVATISPSTEADFRIQTRGGHEECYDDVTWEYYTECESGGYWDDELGGWGGMSVCTTYEMPVYTQVCQWVDDGPDPEDPAGGGGGGYIPPTNPPTNPVVPPTIKPIYNPKSTLNRNELEQLELCFKDLIQSKAFRSMFDDLAKKEIQLSFKVVNDPVRIAYFDKANNSINFAGISNIQVNSLREEFIHAIQANLYYPDMSNSKRNYESTWKSGIF